MMLQDKNNNEWATITILWSRIKTKHTYTTAGSVCMCSVPPAVCTLILDYSQNVVCFMIRSLLTFFYFILFFSFIISFFRVHLQFFGVLLLLPLLVLLPVLTKSRKCSKHICWVICFSCFGAATFSIPRHVHLKYVRNHVITDLIVFIIKLMISGIELFLFRWFLRSNFVSFRCVQGRQHF